VELIQVVNEEPHPATTSIYSAGFRRTSINRRAWPQELHNVKSPSPRPDQIAILKREEMVAFEVSFLNPQWPALRLGQRTVDKAHGAIHSGWIEVLLIHRGKLKGAPSPAFKVLYGGTGDVAQINPIDRPLWAWKQTRRLIVPQDAIGTGTTRMETAVPLQIEATAASGTYDVWARIVRSRDDPSTLWKLVDMVQLTHR
jgi:hypothetical protein